MANRLAKLEKAYRQNPDSPLFARLADLYLKRGKAERALEVCQQGCQHFPDYATGFVVLARCLETSGQVEEARDALDQALRLDPVNPRAYQGLSEVYHKLGVPTLALKSLQQVAALDPLAEDVSSRVDELAYEVRLASTREEPEGEVDPFVTPDEEGQPPWNGMVLERDGESIGDVADSGEPPAEDETEETGALSADAPGEETVESGVEVAEDEDVVAAEVAETTDTSSTERDVETVPVESPVEAEPDAELFGYEDGEEEDGEEEESLGGGEGVDEASEGDVGLASPEPADREELLNEPVDEAGPGMGYVDALVLPVDDELSVEAQLIEDGASHWDESVSRDAGPAADMGVEDEAALDISDIVTQSEEVVAEEDRPQVEPVADRTEIGDADVDADPHLEEEVDAELVDAEYGRDGSHGRGGGLGSRGDDELLRLFQEIETQGNDDVSGVPAASVLPVEDAEDERQRITTPTLAEIYTIQGLTQKAIETYRELLELDPSNDFIRRKLEELEKNGSKK